MIDACPIEAASLTDAEFFASRPERQYRIRPAIPGEFGPAEAGPLPRALQRWVAVRQLRPGIRARASFILEGAPADTEQAAAAWFALLTAPEGPAAGMVGGRGHA